MRIEFKKDSSTWARHGWVGDVIVVRNANSVDDEYHQNSWELWQLVLQYCPELPEPTLEKNERNGSVTLCSRVKVQLPKGSVWIKVTYAHEYSFKERNSFQGFGSDGNNAEYSEGGIKKVSNTYSIPYVAVDGAELSCRSGVDLERFKSFL